MQPWTRDDGWYAKAVMGFEWDDDKQRSNLAKHQVDFTYVRALFDGRPIMTVDSPRRDESRYASTGEVDGRFYTVVWTLRGDTIRLISARRARDAEQRAYRSFHGG